MVLEGDRPSGSDVGKPGVLDDPLSVQHDRDSIASHRDLEAIPLAHGPVRLGPGSDRSANLGRLTRTLFADQTSRQFEYNSDGQLTRTTDPNGSAVVHTYDGLSRLLEQRVARGLAVIGTNFKRFFYDGNNRVVRTENDDAFGSGPRVGTFAYDSLSHQTRDQQGTWPVD